MYPNYQNMNMNYNQQGYPIQQNAQMNQFYSPPNQFQQQPFIQQTMPFQQNMYYQQPYQQQFYNMPQQMYMPQQQQYYQQGQMMQQQQQQQQPSNYIQFKEQLNLVDLNKILDEAIVVALCQPEKQDFCYQVEEHLMNFLSDEEKKVEMIGNIDAFQRKIVHQICDRFKIKRYVQKKDNNLADITLNKTEESAKTPQTIKECYNQIQIKYYGSLIENKQVLTQFNQVLLKKVQQAQNLSNSQKFGATKGTAPKVQKKIEQNLLDDEDHFPDLTTSTQQTEQTSTTQNKPTQNQNSNEKKQQGGEEEGGDQAVQQQQQQQQQQLGLSDKMPDSINDFQVIKKSKQKKNKKQDDSKQQSSQEKQQQ